MFLSSSLFSPERKTASQPASTHVMSCYVHLSAVITSHHQQLKKKTKVEGNFHCQQGRQRQKLWQWQSSAGPVCKCVWCLLAVDRSSTSTSKHTHSRMITISLSGIAAVVFAHRLARSPLLKRASGLKRSWQTKKRNKSAEDLKQSQSQREKMSRAAV